MGRNLDEAVAQSTQLETQLEQSTCVSVVVDQVGQVWNAAAGVASFVTGNAAIAKAVEKLLQLVDFFIQVIFTLIETVRGFWKSYKE